MGVRKNKLNSKLFISPNFSPTNSGACVSLGYVSNASPQLPDLDTGNSPLPVSPHVNVPPPLTNEYRSVPPPLPPRRKERTESCADLAQKRQAPDAPTVSYIHMYSYICVHMYMKNAKKY